MLLDFVSGTSGHGSSSLLDEAVASARVSIP
jgi:hypothetical protein